jgi:hypothetical protein
MNNGLLITFEILLVVVTPLIILYLKSSWPLRTATLCIVSIPILWYFVYSLLHELSHIAGTYLVGGTVIYYKLIPSFWLGEFGRAWITPDGLKDSWQQLTMTASPYILDIVSIVAGIFILRRNFSKNPFIIGFVFMLLFLRPAFDFVCEPIAFLSGDRGDLYHIANKIGYFATWSLILFSMGLSLISIIIILKRFVGFPETLSANGNLTILKKIESNKQYSSDAS